MDIAASSGGVIDRSARFTAQVSGTRRASLAMMFKLALSAQKTWRRLNGHDKLLQLLEGKTFVDGILQDAACKIQNTTLDNISDQGAPKGSKIRMSVQDRRW